jgi:hypothetical protein
VGDADVLYVTGGDATTLAAVIFALHKPTVIGVLDSGGISSALRKILTVADKNPGGATVIYDDNPRSLVERVQRELARRAPATIFEKKD